MAEHTFSIHPERVINWPVPPTSAWTLVYITIVADDKAVGLDILVHSSNALSVCKCSACLVLAVTGIQGVEPPFVYNIIEKE